MDYGDVMLFPLPQLDRLAGYLSDGIKSPTPPKAITDPKEMIVYNNTTLVQRRAKYGFE